MAAYGAEREKMRYKLTKPDNSIMALESDLNEAIRQAKYYLKKDTTIMEIDIIEIDTGITISAIKRE